MKSNRQPNDGTNSDIEAKAYEREAPHAREVYRALEREGDQELRRPSFSLFWSGLAAGLAMGFSMVSQGLLSAKLPDADWADLISKLGYSTGYLIVILGRQQLFTESTLVPVLPVLSGRNRDILALLRLWSVVLLANITGAFVFSTVAGKTDLFHPAAHEIFSRLGEASIAGGFFTVVLRAVFAGWLIGLMIWLIPYSETARWVIIVLLTYLVALGNFAHIITGSVDTSYLVITGQLPLGVFFGRFFVPTLIGNIIGGTVLVAFIERAQVAREEPS